MGCRSRKRCRQRLVPGLASSRCRRRVPRGGERRRCDIRDGRDVGDEVATARVALEVVGRRACRVGRGSSTRRSAGRSPATVPGEVSTGAGGAVVSCTVTVNDPWPNWMQHPSPSNSTVVVRMANVEPDAGTQTTDAVTSPSVSSFAVTVKVTTAPSGVGRLGGHVTREPSRPAACRRKRPRPAIAPIWTITIATTVTMPIRTSRTGVENDTRPERTEEEVACLPTVGAPLWAELARTPDPTLHHPSPTVRAPSDRRNVAGCSSGCVGEHTLNDALHRGERLEGQEEIFHEARPENEATDSRTVDGRTLLARGSRRCGPTAVAMTFDRPHGRRDSDARGTDGVAGDRQAGTRCQIA